MATESERVLKAAARLIRAEICEFDYSHVNDLLENYIYDPEAGAKFVQPLFKTLMNIHVNNKVKELAISNAVLSAARPRPVIAPVLLGVGVQMDHAYGSNWLIDVLARLGFSVFSAEMYHISKV